MKLFLNSAAGGKNHHNYQPSTIASIDFNELVCSRLIECVPSDHFPKVHADGLMRLAPQVFPPFGKVYLKTASFFVPEHQIFSQSESWHNNQTMYKGRTVKLPYLKIYDALNSYLNNSIYATLVDSLSSSTPGLSPANDYPDPKDYDFIAVDGAGGGDVIFRFRKLNAAGRKYYKIFKSLGYDFATPSFHFYDTVPTGYADRLAWIKSTCNLAKSALPLLAYAKVYVDYFISGQHFNGSNIALLLQSIHDVSTCTVSGNTWYDSSSGLLTQAGVYAIYQYTQKLPVIQDMYTSAWNSPNSPLGVTTVDYGAANNGLTSQSFTSLISPYLPTSTNSNDKVFQSQIYGTASENNQGNYLKSISSFGLRVQEAFFKFVTRNNLVGTRPVQRILARFGIKPSDATSHFVSKLFEGSSEITFHPVLSNSDTVSGSNGLPLGSYAGFGQTGLNFDFNYVASDYGYIIVLHWLQIKPIFTHGCDPAVMRLNPFDAFTPEYDGQALRAIPYCEISQQKDQRSQTAITADIKPDDGIYGFTNIYDDYRYLRDNVLGDFLFDETQNYLFARDYTNFRSQDNWTLKPQSDDVQYYSGGGFSDPFQMSAVDGNRFWMYLDYDIDADRPIASESDALMLNGSGSIEVPKNGTVNN